MNHHPQNLFVAGFIGSPRMNFLEGEVIAASGNGVIVGLPQGDEVPAPVSPHGIRRGRKVTLGLRPEHLLEGGGGDAELEGRVIQVERLGAESYIYVERGDGAPLIVKAAGDSQARVDDLLEVGVPASACYLFDEQGRAFARPDSAQEDAARNARPA